MEIPGEQTAAQTGINVHVEMTSDVLQPVAECSPVQGQTTLQITSTQMTSMQTQQTQQVQKTPMQDTQQMHMQKMQPSMPQINQTFAPKKCSSLCSACSTLTYLILNCAAIGLGQTYLSFYRVTNANTLLGTATMTSWYGAASFKMNDTIGMPFIDNFKLFQSCNVCSHNTYLLIKIKLLILGE